MNNSCAWFKRHYPNVGVKNVMIIWTDTVNRAAGFNEDVEIMKAGSLERMVKNFSGFFHELKKADLKNLSEKKLQSNLEAYGLTVDDVLNKYSKKHKQE